MVRMDDIHYHERVREAWVSDIVTNRSDIEREEVLVCQTRHEWIALVPVSFPSPTILEQYGDRGNHPGTVQEEIHGLENIQRMLEIVI